MHRSGTSLVAKVLEKAGIFMGVFKDHNYEALHFLSLNQQTLWAAGASWTQPVVPEAIYYKTIPKRELYHEHFKANSRWSKWELTLQQPPWGWKDPRNTFTLPMWLKMFPKASVLHVYRNVDDTAKSLQKRNQLKGEVFKEDLDDLEFNRELTRRYQQQAFSYKEELGEYYHEISYEEIMRQDAHAISELEIFCGRPLMEIFKQYCRPLND